MKARKRVAILLLVVVSVAIYFYVNSTQKISPTRESSLAPETVGGIGVEGAGGDAMLNKEKNRYTLPVSVSDLSIDQIIQLPCSLLSQAGRHQRVSWPAETENYVTQQEHRGVRVTGYLVHAKESGPESCNGYSDSLRDYHVWISDAPTTDKSRGIIVEITPRWKLVNPGWRLHTIERLAQQHARVRVTGWLMWDEEHPDEVGKSRATQWEVHPVTAFEVEGADGWRALGTE